MAPAPLSINEISLEIVEEPTPAKKVQLASKLALSWQKKDVQTLPPAVKLAFPEQPGRPAMPILLDPHEMPRRRIGSKKGLIALVHSLAHIELNAIDMAFDFIARFASEPLPPEFLETALKVGFDEARHFEMINKCLEDLGSQYGDLPAHGGLWQAARDTGHDLLARLAIVPLVLEARGLDVSPKMIKQVKASGPKAIADVMEEIYRDEITHVAFGAKWFKFICEQRKIDPQETFQYLVKKYFRGALKAPINENARTLAGLTPDFYQPLLKNIAKIK